MPGMPLKILVVAEMSGRDPASGRSAPRTERVRVDKDTFGDVLAGFGVQASLDVRDRLSDRKDLLVVELRFPDLKAFRPEAVVQQLPSTRDLLVVRQALVEARSGRLGLSEARNRLTALQASSPLVVRVRELLEGSGARPAAALSGSPPASVETGSSPAGLDNLLEMVETEPTRGFDPQRLDSLIRQVVASEGSGRGIDPRAA